MGVQRIKYLPNFAYHFRIPHLQAPHDPHIYENHSGGLSYVFYACFHYLIQEQMHAATFISKKSLHVIYVFEVKTKRTKKKSKPSLTYDKGIINLPVLISCGHC